MTLCVTESDDRGAKKDTRQDNQDSAAKKTTTKKT